MPEYAFLQRTRHALIIVFALALSSSISAAQITAGVLFLHMLIRWRNPERWKEMRESYWFWPLLLFITWSALSTALAHPPGLGDALSSQSALLFLFLAAYGLSGNERKTLLKWFCIGAVIVGLWAVAQKLSGVNFLPNEKIYQMPEHLTSWPRGVVEYLAVRNGRAVGPRSHPLTYAESLIPAFFLLVLGFIKEIQAARRSGMRIALFAFGLMAVTSGLVFSEARAVLLGIAAGLLVMGWLISRKTFLMTAIALSAVLLLLVSASPKFRGRMMSVFTNQSGSLGDQQSKSIRFELWSRAIQEIKEHPIRGTGTDGAALTAFDPIQKKERLWSETHNIYLQTALEWGMVGLGLFLWVVALAARSIRSIPGTSRAAFAAVLVAFLAAGCTESWTHDKEIAMIFWLMVGCAHAARRAAFDGNGEVS